MSASARSMSNVRTDSAAAHPDAPSDSETGPAAHAGTGTDAEADTAEDLFVLSASADTTNEPTSPTSPLAPYPPLLPTDTRSRAPEFYGFVAWTSTYLLFVLYLLWAFLPDNAILALGVSWYPNREWSLLVPAYGMVLVLLTYFSYFALALAGTPSFADMRAITDSKAHLPAGVGASASDADNDTNHSSDRPSFRPTPAPAPAPGGILTPDSAPASMPPQRMRTHAHIPSRPPPPPPPPYQLRLSQPPPQRSYTHPKPKPSPTPNFEPYFAHARPDVIPELYDIPLGLVNRVVYGGGGSSTGRVPRPEQPLSSS